MKTTLQKITRHFDTKLTLPKVFTPPELIFWYSTCLRLLSSSMLLWLFYWHFAALRQNRTKLSPSFLQTKPSLYSKLIGAVIKSFLWLYLKHDDDISELEYVACDRFGYSSRPHKQFFGRIKKLLFSFKQAQNLCIAAQSWTKFSKKLNKIQTSPYSRQALRSVIRG